MIACLQFSCFLVLFTLTQTEIERQCAAEADPSMKTVSESRAYVHNGKKKTIPSDVALYRMQKVRVSVNEKGGVCHIWRPRHVITRSFLFRYPIFVSKTVKTSVKCFNLFRKNHPVLYIYKFILLQEATLSSRVTICQSKNICRLSYRGQQIYSCFFSRIQMYVPQLNFLGDVYI